MLEVESVGKRVYTFKGEEYPTLGTVKAAMLSAVLTPEGASVPDSTIENVVAHTEQVIEVLRYAGRKPRGPRPPGSVPLGRRPRKGRKARAASEEAVE